MPADVPTSGPNTKAGEKPPVMPVAATRHTPAGAKAFAEFFIRTIDWDFATESGAYASHFANRSCSSCSTLVTGIEADRRAGNRYVGGRITNASASVEAKPTVATAQYTVAVSFSVTAFEKLSRTGRLVNATAAQTGQQFEVSVRWTDSGWTVVKLAVNS